jgi:hypothetical protein
MKDMNGNNFCANYHLGPDYVYDIVPQNAIILFNSDVVCAVERGWGMRTCACTPGWREAAPTPPP